MKVFNFQMIGGGDFMTYHLSLSVGLLITVQSTHPTAVTTRGIAAGSRKRYLSDNINSPVPFDILNNCHYKKLFLCKNEIFDSHSVVHC